ncbi:hypothetical protein CBR_g31940 [Chara braunii]|uniref:VHS domain-containing protein n=1 Tax=Chara braunii TaxID=69332 RepID=A0A388LG40_CHABU|nr:hypothetical protein CBR_g31940 [Chara braunii]|eukprot:GBG81268.1 hypothetical protein CBR_g31940 [Chara braunii]
MFSAPESAVKMTLQAVEAFKRSRLIDAATSDDENITPVYKLDEISELLRTSSAEVIKDVIDHLLKKLDHKSPLVKQKVLRVMKFALGKGGPEFRRELQRHSSTIRALFNYKGQPHPLRGDSLNKAVRETAHDAIQAMFVDAPKGGVGSIEGGTGLGKRIQGFGGGGEGVMGRGGEIGGGGGGEDRRDQSGLSGMIGLGSASLLSGLEIATEVASNIAVGYRSGSGTRRPLNSGNSADDGWGAERGRGDSRGIGFGGYRGGNAGGEREGRGGGGEWGSKQYGSGRHSGEDWGSRLSPMACGTGDTSGALRSPREAGGVENRPAVGSEAGKAAGGVHVGVPLEEDRLVERMTMPGGVRLQPTTEALREFVNTAQRLDGFHLAKAFDRQLRAHAWQSRLKALYALEALLRVGKEGGPTCSAEAVYNYFANDANSVVDCLSLIQTSVRERAKKVLELLTPPERLEEGESSKHQTGSRDSGAAGISTAAAAAAATVRVVPKEPLIDMGENDLLGEMDGVNSAGPPSREDEAPGDGNVSITASPPSVVTTVPHDLLGQDLLSDGHLHVGAPTVGLSLGESGGSDGDPGGLFSGLDVDGGNCSRGDVSGAGGDPVGNLFGDLTLAASPSPTTASTASTASTAAAGGPNKAQFSQVSAASGGTRATGALTEGTHADGEVAVARGKAAGGTTVGAAEAFKGLGLQRPNMKPMRPRISATRGSGTGGQASVHQPGAVRGAVVVPQMAVLGTSGMVGVGMGVGLCSSPQGMVPVQLVPGTAFVPTQLISPGMGMAGRGVAAAGGTVNGSVTEVGGAGMGMRMGPLGLNMRALGNYCSDFMGDATTPSQLLSAESTKKKETKAFDFISDHVSAAAKQKQTSG